VLREGVLASLHEGVKIDLDPPSTHRARRYSQHQFSHDVSWQCLDVCVGVETNLLIRVVRGAARTATPLAILQ
jgi:hypothetical protein